MRNTEMARLSGLVGEWTTTMSDAWFLEPPGTTVQGTTTIEWRGESLLVVRSVFGGGQHEHSEMGLVLGRSDSNDRFVALYQDDRGVCRQFAMTFDGGRWLIGTSDVAEITDLPHQYPVTAASDEDSLYVSDVHIMEFRWFRCGEVRSRTRPTRPQE